MENEKPEIESNKSYSGKLDCGLNFIKKSILAFVCRRIQIDEKSISIINETKDKGIIVYASFQSNNIALIIYYWVLSRLNLLPPVYAYDYNPFYIQNFTYIIKRLYNAVRRNIFRKKFTYILDTDHIKNLLTEKNPVIFPILSNNSFLRRYIEKKYDFLIYLIDLQKTVDTPIYIIPQNIFWNRSPEKTNDTILDKILKNESVIFNILTIATPSYIHLMEPVSLKNEIDTNKNLTSDELALYLRYKFIETNQKEKRLVLGPILNHQSELMEKVLYHENIQNTINQLNEKDKAKKSYLKKKAYRYYKEIAADFSIRYIKLLELLLDIVFKKLFSGIDYDQNSLDIIRNAIKKGAVILTPCHKSHMDYLILSYIFFKNKIIPPHVAAGVNLSFFPVGSIFRHSGAFFLRRSFRGMVLYTAVFKQYIKTLVKENYPIEFFLEGGRTRTGRLIMPKHGLLSYVVEAIDDNYADDLVFVPISISYDRVLEEASYEKESKGKEKKKENVGAVVKSTSFFKKDWGKVYVRVDDFFTLKDVEKEGFTGDDRITEIGKKIILGINRVAAVNPISVVTSAILFSSVKGFTKKKLIHGTEILYDYLSTSNVHSADWKSSDESIVQITERMIENYINERILENARIDENNVLDEVYLIKDDVRLGISFYKNTISHFFIIPSLVSISILNALKENNLSLQNVTEKYNILKELLSNEFVYSKYVNNSEICVPEFINSFLTINNIAGLNDSIITVNEQKTDELVFFSRAMQELIESYYIVVNSITRIKDRKINMKDLILEIRKNGVKLYSTDKVRAAESLHIIKVLIKKRLYCRRIYQ